MSKNIHPEEFLNKYIMPGQAFFSKAIIEEKNKEKNEVCALLIKEELKNIKKIKKYNPQISSRLGLTRIDGVYIIVYMFCFVDVDGILYETVLNYCNKEGKECLELLAKQQNLYFIIYDEKGNIIRKIVMKNSLQETFDSFKKVVEPKHFEWSMSEFDTAKEKLYQIYPSPLNLWNELGKGMLNF